MLSHEFHDFRRDPVVTQVVVPGGGDEISGLGRVGRLEQVRQDFVANVSHELKTPLTIISGFIDLLASPEAAGDEEEKKENGTPREELARKVH